MNIKGNPVQASRLRAIMASGKVFEGILAINKPMGLSSAQVLRNLQTHFDPSETFAPLLESETIRLDMEDEMKHRPGTKRKGRFRGRGRKNMSVKIGHGGTLDPMATGVLITGIGKGTKSLSSFLDCTKTYEAVVMFGVATDSYDRLGKIVGRKPFEHITKEMVVAALDKFRGKIMQRPPIFSALRMDGKRLYEYAREGKAPPRELEARPMQVKELELVEWMDGGSHGYAWPSDEANAEMKTIASKLILRSPRHRRNSSSDTQDTQSSKEEANAKNAEGRGEGAGTPQANQEKVEEESATSQSLKRKRSSTPTSNTGPYMSGALPSSPTPAAEKEQEDADTENPINRDDSAAGESESTLKSEALPSPPAVRIRMTVTSGFYVRSFCHDLGVSLNSLAVMADLVRTRQANFKLGDNVLEYDELGKGEEVWGPRVQSMLNEWQKFRKAEHEQSYYPSDRAQF